MEQLRDIGEDALIRRIVSELSADDESVIVGPGDDCAVVDVGREGYYQLLKTDSVIEGVHYLSSACPREVGWKSAARVISDFAAMGGVPHQLLITIALPEEMKVDDVVSLYQGINHCAVSHGAVISGGETARAPHGSAAMISVSGTGWVRRDELVTRAGASAGDVVLVTGRLGGSLAGKHLTFQPRLAEAQWLTENFQISAMMDLSDGLAKDLPRLAAASCCSFRIDETKLPCSEGCDGAQAIGDGEDYELLLCVSPEIVSELKAAWSQVFPDLELTAVGELTADQVMPQMASSGWEHFSSD